MTNEDAIEALEQLARFCEYSASGKDIPALRAYIKTICTALENGPEVVSYWDFEDEMEDVTNRDNGKIVSAFIMKRFPNGLKIAEEKV